MGGEPWGADDDDELTGDGSAVFIPGLVLNLVPLVIRGIPIMLDSFSFGALFVLPMTLNIAAAIVAREKPGRLERWLCTIAVPGNVVLAGIAATGFATVHIPGGNFYMSLLACAPAATFWQTARCWRHYRREKAGLPPPAALSK